MTTLNLAVFKKQVELYSADLSRWPQDMIHPALDFMQQNEAARKFFNEMERVENMLRYDAPAQFNAAQSLRLQDSIMAAIHKGDAAPKGKTARKSTGAKRGDGNFLQKWFDAYLAPAASGLIAACFLGIIVGLVPAAQAGDIDPFAASAVTAVGEDASDFEGNIF